MSLLIQSRHSVLFFPRRRSPAIGRLAVLAVGMVCAASARSQVPDTTHQTVLHGIVLDPKGGPPAEGALVELWRDSTRIRRTNTTKGGWFTFDSISTGEYRLRIYRIGVTLNERQVTLVGPLDSVHIELVDTRQRDDSLQRVAWQQKLAAARARPRHWTCGTPSAEVDSIAREAYERFPGSDYAGMRAAAREYGMPSKWNDFRHDFQAVTSPDECRRLAETLDRQLGFIDDHITIFRTGKIYYIPDIGDGGTIVGLDGKVIGIYIVPS